MDSAARLFVRSETVHVDSTTQAGELVSLEGPNRYASGDVPITGSTGDCWVVSCERSDAKYAPADAPLAQGQAGTYRNRPSAVLTKQTREAFLMACFGVDNALHGRAGGWMFQYVPSDYDVAQARRFAKVYYPA